MAASTTAGAGTKENPWTLKTAPGTSGYEMWRDESADPPALVCQVGGTQLRYQLRCIQDLHSMLKQHGDWMPLGGADEQKPAAEGTVEAWGRSPANPVGGWYGMKKGLRGRFGVYLPPLLEPPGVADGVHRAHLRDGQVVADEELEIHRAAEGARTEAAERRHERFERRVALENRFG